MVFFPTLGWGPQQLLILRLNWGEALAGKKGV